MSVSRHWKYVTDVYVSSSFVTDRCLKEKFKWANLVTNCVARAICAITPPPPPFHTPVKMSADRLWWVRNSLHQLARTCEMRTCIPLPEPQPRLCSQEQLHVMNEGSYHCSLSACFICFWTHYIPCTLRVNDYRMVMVAAGKVFI